MTAILFDHPLTDEARRERVYAGQILVYSPRPGATALCDHVRAALEDTFAPLYPRTAELQLAPDAFSDTIARVKTRLIGDPRTNERVQACLDGFGCDLDSTYFRIQMRTPPSGRSLDPRIGALSPHRDTWFFGSLSQVNWWIPIHEIDERDCMAFYPQYWQRPIRNRSGEHLPGNVTTPGRRPPIEEPVDEPLELDADLRVICRAGGAIVFSGAHLHGTVPNTSGRTRFNFEIRTVHLDDLRGRRGAPNHDTCWTANPLSWYWSARDFSPVPADVMALYEDEVVAPPAVAGVG